MAMGKCKSCGKMKPLNGQGMCADCAAKAGKKPAPGKGKAPAKGKRY